MSWVTHCAAGGRVLLGLGVREKVGGGSEVERSWRSGGRRGGEVEVSGREVGGG